MEFYVKSYLDRQIKRGICGKHFYNTFCMYKSYNKHNENMA